MTSTVGEVSNLPPSAADDPAFVAHLTRFVNDVYTDAERGLWHASFARTNPDEMAAIIRAGELAAARLDGAVVGVIRTQRLTDDLAEFGLLAASPEHRGLGIGRDLVAHAEGWARTQHLPAMQLELLVPRDWTHPVKAFLRDWYTRIGYRHVRTEAFDQAFPHLQPHLATDCDLTVYHKPL